MPPPRRVRVAGIAPEEPGLVAGSLDHRIQIVGPEETVIRKIPCRLLMQFTGERAIHALRLQHLNKVRDAFMHAPCGKVGGIVLRGDGIRQRDPLVRISKLGVTVVAVAPDAVHVREQSAVDRRLAGRADALRAEGAREVHTAGSERIKIRRLQSCDARIGLTRGAFARVVADVLDIDEEYVGLGRCAER